LLFLIADSSSRYSQATGVQTKSHSISIPNVQKLHLSRYLRKNIGPLPQVPPYPVASTQTRRPLSPPNTEAPAHATNDVHDRVISIFSTPRTLFLYSRTSSTFCPAIYFLDFSTHVTIIEKEGPVKSATAGTPGESGRALDDGNRRCCQIRWPIQWVSTTVHSFPSAARGELCERRTSTD
jgi:hypothetical protein